MISNTIYPECESQLRQSWDEIQNPEQKKYFLLGIIAVGTTLNDQALLNDWLPQSLDVLDQDALEEVILQTLLFAGFPKTIEALKVLRNHLPVIKGQVHVNDRQTAGERTSQIIYGKHHPKLKRVMDELHPDLTRWMIEDGYGRVLSRPGLGIQEREIGVLASLMASGMIHQFRAHIRGAMYAGVSKVDIIWFTNTFHCIIAADLKTGFNQVVKQVLES